MRVLGRKIRSLLASAERRLVLPGKVLRTLKSFQAPCILSGTLGQRMRQSVFELHMGSCVVLVDFRKETELYAGEKLALTCQSDASIRLDGNERLCFRVLSYSIN